MSAANVQTGFNTFKDFDFPAPEVLNEGNGIKLVSSKPSQEVEGEILIMTMYFNEYGEYINVELKATLEDNVITEETEKVE